MAKVRSAKVVQYRFRRPTLWACAIAVAGLAAAPSARADPPVHVTIALLPNGTGVDQVGRVPGMSPGILSAGLGTVPPDQTYLDITQGNRIFNSLYDRELPLVNTLGFRVPRWREVLDRAESAPADIVPGLLRSMLQSSYRARGRATMAAAKDLVLPALLAADREGTVLRVRSDCAIRSCPVAVAVANAQTSQLARSVRALRGDDLLIALERPPPPEDHQLTIGIAGRGFDGNLTSDSTRMGGYVLSTDIAPTILERLGVGVPSEMTGEPIRAEGSPDAADVASLEDRLSGIGDRRAPVIGISLLVWLALAGLVAAATRGRLGRLAVQLLTLSCVYLPSVLLLTAGLEPSESVERLIVMLGAPLLAAVTLLALRGYRALAVACGVTTLAYAVDVIAGSPLTSLSLMGPNPGQGVRFFGIGNELEATLTPLILVGTGAAITALRPDLPPRRCAAVFLAVAMVLALVFAAGRFGADVGAAIVFPAGAAAAVAALGAGGRTVLLVLALPLAALAALAVIDLLFGGDAHLTRSVLDAGGLDSVADVAERRLRLSARSFGRAAGSPFLPLVVLILAVAIWKRELILGWFDEAPALRAGFLGAAAATLVGTLANDSGALLLEVGTAYLLLISGYAWAQGPRELALGSDPRPSNEQRATSDG
ncbi:MAG: hypothetical protein AABM29_03540 [Actinomycetota bacterium]